MRQQHGYRLPQHGRLGFDAPHAPSQYAEAIDHGGVRIGSHQGVRISLHLSINQGSEDRARKIFQIDLMDNAHLRRNHGKILEGALSPAQEGIALAITLKLKNAIGGECLDGAELVHLNGVINHQLGRLQRIDQRGVAAEFLNGVAHGRKIHHCWDSSEVLHEHPRRSEADFVRGLLGGFPAGESADVFGGYRAVIFIAQQVFEKDAQREGKMRGGKPLFV